MKPLLMLDQVMLWLARRFTAGVLILFGFPFVMLVLLFFMGLGLYLFFPKGGEPFIGASASLHQMLARPQQLVDLAFALLWFFSVRLLPSLIVRICLGVTAGLALICFFSSLLIFPRLLSHENFSTISIVAGLIGLFGFVGSGAVFWSALRPPQHVQLPQNPVNSV